MKPGPQSSRGGAAPASSACSTSGVTVVAQHHSPTLPVPVGRQCQCQQHQGLTSTGDGMKALCKASDGLCGFSFGCMHQPRDTLAV